MARTADTTARVVAPTSRRVLLGGIGGLAALLPAGAAHTTTRPGAPSDRTPDDDAVCITKEAAALDFEPWPADFEAAFPCRAEFMESMRAAWPTIRMVATILTRTKPDMVAACSTKPEASIALLESVGEVSRHLGDLAEMLACAEARLLCAASVCALQDEGAAA